MSARPPYDVSLDEWLNIVGSHPADTPVKQLAFGVTRQAVANLGAMLHPIIPASADKSTAYRLLGEVLMYLNRALAVGGGPHVEHPDALVGAEEQLRAVKAALEAEAEALGAWLQSDARYDRQQLTDPPPVTRTPVDVEPASGYVSPFKGHGHDGDHHAMRAPERPTHLAPAIGHGTMPCCGRSPLELDRRDRMTSDPDMVTCPGRETSLGAEVTPADEPGPLERPAGLPDSGHAIDIPTGTGGHVRVTAAPNRVALEVLDANGRATFTQPDPLSMLLQTIAAAGGNAFE